MIFTAHEIKNGYFYNDVKVFVNRKLRYMPYAQAGWIDCVQDTVEEHVFFSYSSEIFRLQRRRKDVDSAWGEWIINRRFAAANMQCSRTTSRQVTMALREYGFTDKTIADIKKHFAHAASNDDLYLWKEGK